jgi:hypothetical protein
MSESTLADIPQPNHWTQRRTLIEGIALGVFYGLALRWIMGDHATANPFPSRLQYWIKYSFNVMTIGFVFFGPLVIGFLTINRATRHSRTSVVQWIFAPWLSIAITCALTFILGGEGRICILFLIPIALVGSSIGGILAGVAARSFAKRSNTTAACFALLPFLIAPAESRLRTPLETRTVSSQILIHASSDTIWQNIERVPAISPNELQTTWAQRIGFPRPVEATLSYEGVGGVRHASFERGLMFIETITAWEPDQRIAFSIKADTAHIPPTTLDEHVTIGGRYFDVLDGEYRLEPLPNGDVLLHLTSHQRLSTDFNGYAGLWTDAVMQNLQSSILAVIRNRCESQPQPQQASTLTTSH